MADQFIKEVASNLGNMPFIYYGSYQLEVHDISYFSLFYSGSLPCVKISFYDTLNLMKDKALPLDDSKIKIFLNPRSTQLKEILIQFKITSFNVNGARYNMEGVLDINLLHVIQFKSYPNLTSHKVLQQIAREAGIGFNTNIDNTNDQMTWINTGSYVSDFIEEIVDSSYKSDQSFMVSYVDYYYNFNFVDLAKELDRNIDNDLGITDRSLSEAVKKIDKETLTNLIISNDESFRETNLYFSKYKIINNSTAISLQAGYKNIVQYYDTLKKDLLVFNIDSITSKDNKSIILKGSPQDEEFYKLNTNVYYVGTLDTDNCHTNYNFAHIQNEKNIFDLEKIGLEVIMRTPNYGIYKYQKIKVFISNQTSTPSATLKNERLSGDWLIIDIKYTYSDGSFTQTVKLVKRELELSNIELSNEIQNSPKMEPNKGIQPNTDVNINVNTIITPISSTASNTHTLPPETNTILTKDIWRRIYKGKVNPKIVELMYNPVVSAIEKYNINTKQRICAFLSQINISSMYLLIVEENDGSYNNSNVNLGNNSTDGVTYKGRGLIQIIGKNMYKKIGEIIGKDIVTNPTIVSADNKTHLVAGDTFDQSNNSALVSAAYWLKGSSWGDLNNYADKMDITKTIDTSSYYSEIPNSKLDIDFGITKSDNFSNSIISSNDNLSYFTSICFGITGGYDGYSDRIHEWNKLRQYFQ